MSDKDIVCIHARMDSQRRVQALPTPHPHRTTANPLCPLIFYFYLHQLEVPDGEIAMSLSTYWLVVPTVGLCVTVPLWLWLRLTRPKHKTGE
jgi:hypothetical protein